MSNIRVGAAIAASFAYLSTAWSRATGIMAAGVILTIALQIAQPTLASVPVLGIVVFFARVCIGTMMTGALYRIGVGPDHPGDAAYAVGPSGFQWGALEWRVLGANLLLGLVLIVPLVVIIIVWGVGLGATLGAGHSGILQALQSPDNTQRLAAIGQLATGPAGVISAVILIPTVLALIYVGARLSLYALQAADARSFSFAQAWRLTRGAVLAVIVTSVIIFIVEIVAGAVVGGIAGFIAGLTGHHGAGGIWGGRAGQTVETAINAPLFAGLLLYVYQARRAGETVAATFA